MTQRTKAPWVALVACCALCAATACRSGDLNRHLAGDYHLIDISADQVFIAPEWRSSTTPWIPDKVVALSWNKRFILAKQQKMPYQLAYYPKTEGAFAYWILDVEVPAVAGPFDEDELRDRVSVMGLEDLLPLRDTDALRD